VDRNHHIGDCSMHQASRHCVQVESIKTYMYNDNVLKDVQHACNVAGLGRDSMQYAIYAADCTQYHGMHYTIYTRLLHVTVRNAVLTVKEALNERCCPQMTPLHHLDSNQPICDKAKKQCRDECPWDCKD